MQLMAVSLWVSHGSAGGWVLKGVGKSCWPALCYTSPYLEKSFHLTTDYSRAIFPLSNSHTLAQPSKYSMRDLFWNIARTIYRATGYFYDQGVTDSWPLLRDEFNHKLQLCHMSPVALSLLHCVVLFNSRHTVRVHTQTCLFKSRDTRSLS